MVTKSLSLEKLKREFVAHRYGYVWPAVEHAFHEAAYEWGETLRYDPETGQVFYKDTAIVLGDILADVDGYEKYFPRNAEGTYWTPEILRAIADLVDELNQEWDRKIQEYFDAAETSERAAGPPAGPG